MKTRREFLKTSAFAAGALGWAGLTPRWAAAQPTSAKPEKLVAIVTSTYGPMLEAFAQEWTKETAVPVEVISQSYDTTYTKVVTALAGGSATDIVIVDSIWTAAFVQAGFLKPLDKYVAPFQAELVPAAIDQRKIGGVVYSMPISNEAKFFYYNAEILEKAGLSAPPRTWEEVNQVGQDLKSKGLVKFGNIWGWQQAEGLICDFALLVADLGGKLASDDGTWLADDAASLGALQFMVDQLKSGAADPASTSLSDRQVVDSFSAGEHAFLLSWSFALGALNNPENSKVVGKIRLDLVPGFASAGTESSTVLGGSGFGIASTSQHEDWAWDLIRFATDKVRQIEVYKIRSNVPVWKELYTAPKVIEQYPYIKQMEEQFKYSSWRPNQPNYAEASSILQVQIHRALNGEVEPKAALDEARARINAL